MSKSISIHIPYFVQQKAKCGGASITTKPAIFPIMSLQNRKQIQNLIVFITINNYPKTAITLIILSNFWLMFNNL